MLKKFISVKNICILASFAKQLSPKAFDNSAAPDEDKTAELIKELGIEIPEDKAEVFEKFKQTLIDKGVGIGTARQSKKAGETASRAIAEFLAEKGLSEDELADAKALLESKGSFAKILEKFEKGSADEVLAFLEEQERNQMTEDEKLKKDFELKVKEVEDLKKQLGIATTNKSKKEQEAEEKTVKLFGVLQKHIVGSKIKALASDFGAYDPDDIAERLSTQVILEEVDGDFVPFVVDAKREKVFDNETTNPLSLESLVRSYIESKPHLAKSVVKSGAGKGGSQDTAPKTGKFTPEQLNDPTFVSQNYAAVQEALRKGEIKF